MHAHIHVHALRYTEDDVQAVSVDHVAHKNPPI